MDFIWVNRLKNVGPPFFQIYGMSVYKCTCIKMSFAQLEIILSCYVAMILQMKDYCLISYREGLGTSL